MVLKHFREQTEELADSLKWNYQLQHASASLAQSVSTTKSNASHLVSSIKKKVKGGPASQQNNCKTLPPQMPVGGAPGMGMHGGPGGNMAVKNSLKMGGKHGNGASDASGDVISSAIVKYNYTAQQLDELSLVKGSRVLILEKSGDGWWRGQLGQKTGWFPSNYTQEELEDAHTYCMAENVLDIMVALYAFKAQNDTELSFDKGDRLEVIDRPASDPDWLKARNTQNQIGLVPKNYLVELSQYLTQHVENQNGGGQGEVSNGKPAAPSAASAAAMGGGASNGAGAQMSPAQRAAAMEGIKHQPWYYGAICRAECDNVLSERGIDGDFLIRDSETNVSSKLLHW